MQSAPVVLCTRGWFVRRSGIGFVDLRLHFGREASTAGHPMQGGTSWPDPADPKKFTTSLSIFAGSVKFAISAAEANKSVRHEWYCTTCGSVPSSGLRPSSPGGRRVYAHEPADERPAELEPICLTRPAQVGSRDGFSCHAGRPGGMALKSRRLESRANLSTRRSGLYGSRQSAFSAARKPAGHLRRSAGNERSGCLPDGRVGVIFWGESAGYFFGLPAGGCTDATLRSRCRPYPKKLTAWRAAAPVHVCTRTAASERLT